MYLLLTPGFAAHEADTTCIPPLQLLVKGLAEKGIPLGIIALEYPFSDQPYTWHGVPVFPCNGQNRRWLRWRTHSRARKQAMAWHQQSPISGLHSFWLGQAWQLGAQLAQQLGCPHTTTLMGQDVLHSVNRRYLSKIKGHSNGWIAVSHFQAAAFHQSTGQTVHAVIPWGMDAPAPPLGHERPIDLLGVGSLLPVKQWTYWLETVALLHQPRPRLKAVLIGDGPERAFLQRQCAALGLQETVVFMGNLPRPQVLEYMAQSKVLLHTARFESFGFVLLEARLAGCTVVGTPVGIAPELGHTATTAEGLHDLVAAHLQSPSPTLFKNIFTTDRTVTAYLNFWHGIGSTI